MIAFDPLDRECAEKALAWLRMHAHRSEGCQALILEKLGAVLAKPAKRTISGTQMRAVAAKPRAPKTNG